MAEYDVFIQRVVVCLARLASVAGLALLLTGCLARSGVSDAGQDRRLVECGVDEATGKTVCVTHD